MEDVLDNFARADLSLNSLPAWKSWLRNEEYLEGSVRVTMFLVTRSSSFVYTMMAQWASFAASMVRHS